MALADLEARGAAPRNARMPRTHLPAVLLAKPVGLLVSGELEQWRNGLLSKIKPATANRVCNALRAALERCARHDKRIQNRSAWLTGLSGLPGRGEARNVYLPEPVVLAFVLAAYARDACLGLLTDVLAETGTRPSQATRLRVEDLRDDRLMMPKSGKGGGLNRSEKKHDRFTVPITPALAMRLKAAAAGRAPGELLLLQADGRPWSSDPSRDYRMAIREIVRSIGEDSDQITIYALRHSSIARRLLKNVPIRLVASLHDTSVAQIERNYSKFITEHATDAISRTRLLEDPGPASNIISIGDEGKNEAPRRRCLQHRAKATPNAMGPRSMRRKITLFTEVDAIRKGRRSPPIDRGKDSNEPLAGQPLAELVKKPRGRRRPAKENAALSVFQDEHPRLGRAAVLKKHNDCVKEVANFVNKRLGLEQKR